MNLGQGVASHLRGEANEFVLRRPRTVHHNRKRCPAAHYFLYMSGELIERQPRVKREHQRDVRRDQIAQWIATAAKLVNHPLIRKLRKPHHGPTRQRRTQDVGEFLGGHNPFIAQIADERRALLQMLQLVNRIDIGKRGVVLELNFNDMMRRVPDVDFSAA